jgi:hypothetical protein
VRIKNEEGLVLLFQREYELCQQRVLEDIGKVAGMKKMSVGKHGAVAGGWWLVASDW